MQIRSEPPPRVFRVQNVGECGPVGSCGVPSPITLNLQKLSQFRNSDKRGFVVMEGLELNDAPYVPHGRWNLVLSTQ